MTAGMRYADRPKGRGAGVWLLIGIGCLLVLVPAAVWSWNRHIEAAVANAKAWTITGPPCPTLTRQAYLAGAVHADHAFQLGDVGFARAYGHVSCNFIANDGGRGLGDYPVCQFTSPAVLRITTPQAEVYFFPSTGPATVSVPHGTPRCVMASRFRGEP
jgi:hypothetical protein